MSDSFGNYVIQYIISMKKQSYLRMIYNQLHNKLCYLSKQKFSSNVIEKVNKTIKT